MKTRTTILFLLILTSCETNWGDYGGYKLEYDSALDYYIVLDKVDTILKDYPYYNKGAIINYFENDSTTRSDFSSNGGKIIGSYVDAKKTNSDSQFILVAQKPLSSICECNEGCFEQMKSYDNRLYPRCKSALERSSYYEYWIINKKENFVYGPFNKNEFENKKIELGVSIKLKLLNEQ